MSIIKGIHHVALSTSAEKYPEVEKFYCTLLGFRKIRDWKGGHMYDTGAGIIEVLERNDPYTGIGSFQHLAFAVDSPDEIIEKVRSAGYEIRTEPRDVTIMSEPPLPIRLAFCYGPMGEIVEFFAE